MLLFIDLFPHHCIFDESDDKKLAGKDWIEYGSNGLSGGGETVKKPDKKLSGKSDEIEVKIR